MAPVVAVAKLAEEKSKTAKEIAPEWAKPVKDWLDDLVSLAQSDDVSEEDFTAILERSLGEVSSLSPASDVLEESLWVAQAEAYKMGWEVYEEADTVEAGKSSGRGIPCEFSYIAHNKVCRVNQLIDGSISGKGGNVKLGLLTKRAVRRYQAFVPLGNKKDDLSVYEASISPSSVIHIKKNHGTRNEGKRGQIRVRNEDFYYIPKIVRDPGRINLSKEAGAAGERRFELYKKINGVGYNVIVEQSKKKRTLSLITMWKTP